MILDLWKKRVTEGQMLAKVKETDSSPLAQLMVAEAFSYFAHGEPSELKNPDVLRHLKHFHMKFFHVDDNLKENAVRVPEIVKSLKEAGYQDSISAEYEGHHWFAHIQLSAK